MTFHSVINTMAIFSLFLAFFALNSRVDFNHKRLLYLECVAHLDSGHEMCKEKEREIWKP